MSRPCDPAASADVPELSPAFLRAVVLVEMDGRTAKVTVGGVNVGAPDLASIAGACFQAIVGGRPGLDSPDDRRSRT